MRFGPRWQGLLRELRVGDGEGLARFELDERFSPERERMALHPALLDAATGVALLLGVEGSYLPLGYEEIRVHAPLPREVYSHFRLHRDSGREALACDVSLLDADGLERVTVHGYTLRRVEPQALSRALEKAPRTAVAAPGDGILNVYSEGIAPSEGVRVLDRLLSLDVRGPQILVSTRDFPALLRQASSITRRQVLTAMDRLSSQVPVHARPNLPVPYVAPRNDIEEKVTAVVGAVLRLERVGIHDSFFDLGGDSLMATNVVSRLNDIFEVELSLRTVFESPTATELSVAIVQRQAVQMDAQDLVTALEEVESLSPEELGRLLGEMTSDEVSA
jgi:acyl carrier protein